MSWRTQLFLIIILCSWLSHYFCDANFSTNKFYKSLFYKKTGRKFILIKVHSEAKFQGIQLLPKELFMFIIAKFRSIEFCFGKRTILFVSGIKGQSSTSRATPCCTRPQGHTTPKKSAAGALFRYINSLENLQSFLNLRGVFSSQCLLTLNNKIFIDCYLRFWLIIFFKCIFQEV